MELAKTSSQTRIIAASVERSVDPIRFALLALVPPHAVVGKRFAVESVWIFKATTKIVVLVAKFVPQVLLVAMGYV